MVVEVCYHDFILVIYSHKVRTWKQQRKQEKEKGKMRQRLLYNTREEVPDYFWTLKTQRTQKTLRVDVGHNVGHDRADASTWKKNMEICLLGSHSQGNSLLTENWARFTNLLLQCNVCTTFF